MKVSPFQITEARGVSGLITANHFRAFFQEDAQVAGNVMNRLLENRFGTHLFTSLNKFPKQYFDHDGDYTWKLQGAFLRNIPLHSARWQGALVTSGTNNVGSSWSEFELIFEEAYFTEEMTIVGELNEVYPIRLKQLRMEGTLAVYTAELLTANSDGMPGAELVGGKLFSYETTYVEDTMSIKGSDVAYTTPMTMRNGFATIRKELKAPGNMRDRKLATAWPDPITKKPVIMWTQYQDFMLEYFNMIAKSNALFYGQTNRDQNGRTHNFGRSGNPIKTSAGVRQQMEVSNTSYYSIFSLKFLEDNLLDIAEGRLTNDERFFELRTGERGARAFSQAAAKDFSAWTVVRDNMALRSVSSDFAINARGGGFQFTEYSFANSINVRVVVDPGYSDRVRNKIDHPLGGKAESHRFDIYDIGTVDGDPNIQLAYVTGVENITRWFPGIRSPWDANLGNVVSTLEDSYKITKLCQLGSIVRDPQRTLSMIPEVLAA